jgi:Domain of unknown function (DUF4864)
MHRCTRRTVLVGVPIAALLAAHAGVAFAAGTGGAAAPEVAAQDAADIRATIEAQLEAFRADDAQRAFSYASPAIQAQFGDAQTFLGMVRTGYPVVYRPQSIGFLLAQRIDGATIQRVRMTDTAGAAWLAVYRMQRQPDRRWRIDGCVLVRDDGQTT